MSIRSITTWNMPSGEQITADDDDMTGIVSYYKHNPHIAIEERDFSCRYRNAMSYSASSRWVGASPLTNWI